MAAAKFWRSWRCFALLGLCARVADSASQIGNAQETFGRRSCKFRPLPTDLAEGYATAGAGAGASSGFQVAEVFGVPLAVLVGDGHIVQASVADPRGALMGFTVQVAFHGNAQLVVEATVGQKTLKCTHTWGAGGHMKQCGLTRIQLPAGPVTLTFRATGLGSGLSGGSAACLTLRLDLEISSHEASESARRCFQSALPAAAPPLLTVTGTGEASIPLTTFSSPAPNGVIWKAALPAAQGNSFNRLFASVTFPSMVHPVRILIEELQPWAAIGDEPKCRRRCFTGTATAHGQVVQRLLPPAVPFALWILSNDHDGSGIAGGHCANYDFELVMGPVPLSRMSQEFLGPPSWLCEGGAWPRRLEQSPDGVSTGTADSNGGTLRARRFALRDHFDLTRPPGADASLGGLHALEIQVAESSIFRLTTHAPTVPARPVLVPGRQDQAWLALSNPNSEIFTRRIPAAGREFRHSISTELSPGEYTLLFVMEMPTGGLRLCASLMLNLLLEPLAVGAVQSACASDAGNGILDLQAMAEPLPITAWRPVANSFTVTLPRAAGSYEEGAGDAEGLQIIARSSMNLGLGAADAGAPPVMLHAKVTSPFSTADLQITFYENGQPLGEPMPLPDGNGYRAMAGPVVKDAFYEVVLFHVPRQPSTRTHCVDFDVELAAVSLTPPTAEGQFIAPLPGAENCWTVDELPHVIRVREGEATVLDGHFQLPSDGGHSIQFIASSAVLLRVSVSSKDADVRVGKEPLQFLGLEEDRYFHRGPAGTLSLRARPREGRRLCPVLRMHLVVMQESAAAECRTGVGTLQALGALFQDALVEQLTNNAQLKAVAAVLRPEGEAVTVPLKVNSVAAELRMELGIEAPWLPLEAVLLREGQEEKAWARAHFAGQRLVMLLPSLPQGRYQLKLSFWSTGLDFAEVEAPRLALPQRCATVAGTVALLAPMGRDTSNYREEMLDLPELLSVRPVPRKLIPGWFTPEHELLSSEIYTVPEGGSMSCDLQLESAMIFRMVAEPTDILKPRLTLELKQGDSSLVSTTASGGGVAQQLSAGSYQVVLSSAEQAMSDSVPFFITWGVTAPLGNPADLGSATASCEATTRLMDEEHPPKPTRSTGTWEFKKQLNIASLPNSMKLPVTVPQPCVATIASWSAFTTHHVRVGLATDEGLWVGEQRGRRSSLEIELPPGDYQMMVEEMSPLLSPPPGCMALGVAVSLVPFSSIERSSSALGLAPPFLGSSLGLGAHCDALGALPLPLDAVSSTGGSAAYGGPVVDGRLLMRERVMLTDIHDGRKKIFLRLPASSVLRVAVVSEDAAETEALLEDSNHQQIAAVESHIMGEGQAASYLFEAPASLWISFHREHRVAQSAGCASFDLLVQSAPMQDLLKMSSCGSEPRDLQEMAQKAMEHFHESSITSSEGRLRIPGNSGGRRDATTAALHLQMVEASVVEVEVQFNFLLSNVHLWLDSGSVHGAFVAPRVRPHGAQGAEKNAVAALRLQLDAGEHLIRIRHDPAFPEGGSIQLSAAGLQCAPLSLKLRRVAVRMQRPVVTMPTAPVVSSSDLVLHLDHSSPTTLASLPPDAASHGWRGGRTVAWSSKALSAMLDETSARSGRLVPMVDAGRIWALPLHVENGGGDAEIWFALDRRKSGQPWAGESAARLAPPSLWPADAAAPVSVALSATPSAAAPPRSPATRLPPLAAAVEMMPPPLEPKSAAGGILSTRMICWIVLLGVLVYYLQQVQPSWLLQIRRKYEAIVNMGEREHHFGQLEAAAEMTNPWTWPTTIPNRPAPRRGCGGGGAASAQPRMYGTLDL